jgi:hypothetical protein
MVCLLVAIKKRYVHPKAIPINQPATPPKNQLNTKTFMYLTYSGPSMWEKRGGESTASGAF